MEIVKIDLVPSGVMPSCHASQYDIGREIRFLLTDGGEEYTLAGTETISIELRKPDGTSETIAIPNTSSNYVDWETSDGELDLSGVYLAEISIKNGDDVLGSANFIMEIEADAYDGTGVHVETVGPADICTFETTLPEPLQSLTVNVTATGGNGTPDNPNPINGYTEANITVNGNTVTIAFGQTVYGGQLIILPDRTYFHATHTYIKGDFEQYNASNGYKAYRRYNCPKSKTTYSGGLSNMVSEFGSFNSDNMTKNVIQLPDLTFGTCYMALVATANPNDVEIAYELATPFDIDLTPEVISAIVGENNVFADCGQTTVKYLKAGA